MTAALAAPSLRHPIGVSLFNHMREALLEWLEKQELADIPASDVGTAQMAVTMELFFILAGGRQDYQAAIKFMHGSLPQLADLMWDLLISTRTGEQS